MLQRGRKSTAASVVSFAANGTRSKLNAPAILSTDERSLFDQIVAYNPHLGPGDVPLLAVLRAGTFEILLSFQPWRYARLGTGNAHGGDAGDEAADYPAIRVQSHTLGRKKPQVAPSAYDLLSDDDDD